MFGTFFYLNTTSKPSYAARSGCGSLESNWACVPCSVRAIWVRYTGWPAGGVYRLIFSKTRTMRATPSTLVWVNDLKSSS